MIVAHSLPRRGWLALALAGLLIFAPFGWAAPASAAAGDLDPAFGDGGKVTTTGFHGMWVDNTPFDGVTNAAHSVAVQADGKIVAAGEAFDHNISNPIFALARYNSNGSLDTTFGDQDPSNSSLRTGKVTTVFSGHEIANSVAVQADGKIVAAGLAYNVGLQGYQFALARYNADGILDTTFDGDGKVTTSFFESVDIELSVALQVDIVRSVAVQADGKIVAAGSSQDPYTGIVHFALARYNADGSLDTTFDGDGKVTTSFFGFEDIAYSLAVQAGGKIVVAGSSQDPYTGIVHFALARYNADGSLDTTFDGDGKVTTSFFGFEDIAYSLAVQAGGKIVVAGYASVDGSKQFALARYNIDGSLDTNFGTDGKVTTSFSGIDDRAFSVAVQAGAKIVAAGTTLDFSGHYQFALARYNANGSLDMSFGGDGKVTTDFFTSSQGNIAHAVALQADGKIVAAGLAFNPSDGGTRFALARYDGGPQQLPFADFRAKAEIKLLARTAAIDDRFEVKAVFTLGAGNDGIDLLTDDVTLRIGAFAITIPGGSFRFVPAKKRNPAHFEFEGRIGGVKLEAKITPLAPAGKFEFEAEGKRANLSGAANPVTVALTIGEDDGGAAVKAKIERDRHGKERD